MGNTLCRSTFPSSHLHTTVLMSPLRESSPARPGDYFEFFAEIDVLCALSTCPGGDLSAWGWGEGKEGVDMVDCCKPLGVELYKITDLSVLKDWRPPLSPQYRGMHGVQLSTFQK